MGRLITEQGQIIHEANTEIAKMKAEGWANLDHATFAAKKRRGEAQRECDRLKAIRADLRTSVQRFRRSRACWPHPDRKTA